MSPGSRNATVVSLWFVLALGMLVLPARAELGYVECSTGLRENPRLDGGRTELEMADIDNDGNVDILSIGDHGSPWINTQEHGVMVWFGNGAGGWTNYMSPDTLGYGGIAVGDVNWDGRWDVGYGMHHNYANGDLGDQVLEVALGDGTGRHWVAWDDSLAMEGQDWGMFSTDFADIDNDGDLDLGSISFGADDGIHVYLNLENGAWRRSFGFLGGNSNMEFYFRDVNRDGNTDMIAAHQYGSVWFGNGAGGFSPASTGLPSYNRGLWGLSAGDADNDGGCDVAFANDSGGVEVYRWNGSRWIEFSGSLPGTGDFEGTQLCDMDADGFTDLVALGGGLVKVWKGDGAGNWTEAASISIPTPGYYSALRTGADFDHNGRPDICCVTEEGNWPNDRNYAHAFRESSPAESLRIFPVFPRGGEKFIGGSVQFIDWWSEAPNASSTRVKLELSIQGSSGPWQPIADSLRNAGRHQWLVPPGAVSANCYIRYTVYGPGGAAQGITPRPFTIGQPTKVEEHSCIPGVETGVLVRPNPMRDRLTIEFRSGMAGRVQLALCDVSGRQVCRGQFEKVDAGCTLILRMDGVTAGTYFLRVEDRAGAVVRRIVKTN